MILSTDEALLMLGVLIERHGGVVDMTLDEMEAVQGKYLGRTAVSDGTIGVYVADGPKEH